MRMFFLNVNSRASVTCLFILVNLIKHKGARHIEKRLACLKIQDTRSTSQHSVGAQMLLKDGVADGRKNDMDVFGI